MHSLLITMLMFPIFSLSLSLVLFLIGILFLLFWHAHQQRRQRRQRIQGRSSTSQQPTRRRLNKIAGLSHVLAAHAKVARRLRPPGPFLHRRSLRQQFPAQSVWFLITVAHGLQAGAPLPRIIDTTIPQSPEPFKGFLQHVAALHRTGMPLSEAFHAVGLQHREPLGQSISLILAIAEHTGSSLATLCTSLAESIRDQDALKKDRLMLTAPGRANIWVISLLMPLLILMISLLNPHYLHPLWTTSIGWLFLAAAGTSYGTGLILLHRMVNSS